MKVRSQAPTFTAIYLLTSPQVWKSGPHVSTKKKLSAPLQLIKWAFKYVDIVTFQLTTKGLMNCTDLFVLVSLNLCQRFGELWENWQSLCKGFQTIYLFISLTRGSLDLRYKRDDYRLVLLYKQWKIYRFSWSIVILNTLSTYLNTSSSIQTYNPCSHGHYKP